MDTAFTATQKAQIKKAASALGFVLTNDNTMTFKHRTFSGNSQLMVIVQVLGKATAKVQANGYIISNDMTIEYGKAVTNAGKLANKINKMIK